MEREREGEGREGKGERGRGEQGAERDKNFRREV